MTEEREYTVKEVVALKLLPFCELTVRKHIKRGILKAKNYGTGTKKNLWRITQSNIDDYKRRVNEGVDVKEELKEEDE